MTATARASHVTHVMDAVPGVREVWGVPARGLTREAGSHRPLGTSGAILLGLGLLLGLMRPSSARRGGWEG